MTQTLSTIMEDWGAEANEEEWKHLGAATPPKVLVLPGTGVEGILLVPEAGAAGTVISGIYVPPGKTLASCHVVTSARRAYPRTGPCCVRSTQ